MRRVGICALAIVIIFSLVLPSRAFFNSDVKKAKKFMSAQMYTQAIELLTKRINEKPTDEEAHFLLGECSLHTGNYRQASKRFDSAVNLKPELNDRAAQIFLTVAENSKNVSTASQILRIAEKYATRPETQKAIGQTELQLSRRCSGDKQKALKQRAARYLGDAEVYGFEKTQLAPNKYKIVFHTDEPVVIIEKWTKNTAFEPFWST